MSDEKHERDGKESVAFSEGENKAHAGALADDKTLRRTPAPDAPPIPHERSLEPTRKLAASGEVQTAIQNTPDTEPTKIFSNDG